MRNFLRVLLCGFILIAPMMAQRGGGGGRGGGGMGGGGFRGGGGFGGGGFRGGGFGGGGFRGGGFGGGGFRGNSFGGWRGGGFKGGFNRGFRNNFGFRRFNRFNSFNSFYLPFGFGYGYGWGYPYDDFAYYDSPAYNSFYGYGYPTDYSAAYPSAAYPSGGGYYAAAPQQPSSNVVVVYPPQTPPASTVIVDRASPVIREYDEFGQEVGRSRVPMQAPAAPTKSGESPIYLIALRSGEIRVAVAYWVEGTTLHFVTSDHLERQVPLSSVDRDLCVRLNRERQVVFSLPAGK